MKNLESLRVRQPCPRKWDDMKGSDSKRFCEHCNLHVHNLSEMSPQQVNILIKTTGRRCVAYFQRKDGTIRIRSHSHLLCRSFSQGGRIFASLLAMLFPFSFIGCDSKSVSPEMSMATPPSQNQIPPQEEQLMGDIIEAPPVPEPQPVAPSHAAKPSSADSAPIMLGTPIVPEKTTPPAKAHMTVGF